MAANINTSSAHSVSVPIFNGTNYQFWSVKMRTLFRSQELWDLVENGFEELADPEQAPRLTAAQRNELKEKQKKDAKALFFIQQGMEDAVFPRVMGATTAKEAWDLLQEHYQGSSKVVTVKLQALRRDFENLSMKSTESIQNYSVRISSLVNQIRSLGEDLKEQKIVEKVLRSLPPKFDHVVAAIEESKDLSDYSLVELMGSLESHEARLNRSTIASMEQAFQTKVEEKKFENSKRGGFSRNRGGGRGRGSGRSYGHEKNYGNVNFQRACSHCGKNNHDEKNC